MKHAFLFILILTIVGQAAFGSVFSGQGIGIPLTSVLGPSAGRAGLGLAAFDSTAPDLDQPAKFSELSEVRVGVAGEFSSRSIQDNFGNVDKQGEFRFGGFALSIPTYKLFRTGFIIAPYSAANAMAESRKTWGSGITYTERLDGTGGLSRYGLVAALASGNFRFGAETGFIGGSINNDWRVYFDTSSMADGWFVINRQMSGWYGRFGMLYQNGSQRYSLVTQFPARLSVREEVRFAMTNDVTNTTTHFNLPLEVMGGASWRLGAWALGADGGWSQWSQIHSRYFLLQPEDAIYGGCWLERPGKSGLLDPYWSRTSWRMGLRYRKLPNLTTNSKRIEEFTTSLGVTLPTAQTQDFVHLATGYTIRGNGSTNLLQENLFWTSVSVSLSEKWFVREKPTHRKK